VTRFKRAERNLIGAFLFKAPLVPTKQFHETNIMPKGKDNSLLACCALFVVSIVLVFNYWLLTSLLHDIDFRALESLAIQPIMSYTNLFREKLKPNPLQIPIYYINLDTDVERKQFTEAQLKRLGYTNYKRVRAWTETDVRQRVTRKVDTIPNLKKESWKEYGCIASHLMAMYTAVNDSLLRNEKNNLRQQQENHPLNNFPYALIIEDDVQFELPVNWVEMVEETIVYYPKFSILQLTTSNSLRSRELWEEYLNMISGEEETENKNTRRTHSADKQWYLRKWDSDFWSTQAYLINLKEIRPMIESIVNYSPDSGGEYHITFYPPPSIPCMILEGKTDDNKEKKRRNNKLCILPVRIVADIYLYTLFQYVYMSRIPLFNGVKGVVYQKNSIQNNTEKLNLHLKSFSEIDTVIQEIQENHSDRLPSYFLLSRNTHNHTKPVV
jgi:GR25 family glycosyltransferase involved in LPS biosynthesis